MKKLLLSSVVVSALLLGACDDDNENEDSVEAVVDEETEVETPQLTEQEQYYLSTRSQVEDIHQQYKDEGLVENLNNGNAQLVDLDNFYYEPDLANGDDKIFITGGQVELANYYNWDYGNAKENYQSFRLTDFNGETVYIYARRDSEHTKEFIKDVQAGNQDAYYLTLRLPHGANTGTEYMADFIAYVNPFLNNYKE